jgi:hypothetical protein
MRLAHHPPFAELATFVIPAQGGIQSELFWSLAPDQSPGCTCRQGDVLA